MGSVVTNSIVPVVTDGAVLKLSWLSLDPWLRMGSLDSLLSGTFCPRSKRRVNSILGDLSSGIIDVISQTASLWWGSVLF